ncbi:hypothetical protein FE634_19625 [Nocardioides dongxiaopingii]|uniref:hypothetical protein n=1 Tax=Nocardioides TaxID=1839 RepID=UPI0010C76ED3|nr:MULTISPECIES: hypothetical protein [Nocardioides]QCW52070.1 hypothetical protein FE634_19625 [Nocardioides sp. S-1144]
MSGHGTSQWQVRANLYRGWRALGGRLTLDTEALSFEPHGLERALGGGVHYRAPLAQISSVAVARRGFPRKRLVVVTADGTEARFLVPKVEARAADLRRAVPSL